MASTSFTRTSSEKVHHLFKDPLRHESSKIAVFPGSFDPITNGHIDLIDRACSLNLFDQLIVAIGINPGKKARFSLEERVEMLKSVIQPYPIVSIEPYEGLTAQYAINCGAQTIIRGLREFSDFEREFQMARMNRQIAPEVDTLFMMSDLAHTHISSTLAMEVALMSNPRIDKKRLIEMVPPVVVEFIQSKFYRVQDPNI